MTVSFISSRISLSYVFSILGISIATLFTRNMIQKQALLGLALPLYCL